MSRAPAQPKIQINFGIAPALKARLALVAARRQVPEAVVIREALEKFLAAAERR